MRPNRRLTAREAAGDIYYLINTFGCRIRIRVKFNQKSDEDSYIYPLNYKMSKAETFRNPDQVVLVKSTKVEPWFICQGDIMVSFNSCFPYIEIQDVYGRWHGSFIDIYHDKGNTPTFDIRIRWEEDLNMLKLYKKPSQVRPGDIYSYYDSSNNLDRLAIVSHITTNEAEESFIIHTISSDKYAFEDCRDIGEHEYIKDIKNLDSENYFVLLKHINNINGL